MLCPLNLYEDQHPLAM